MDRFYVISNSMKDPEGKIAKEIKAYLNFRGKQCIIQERQGKESLRSYKYTNANLIPDDTECILVVGGDGTLLQAARDMIERNIPLLGVNKGTLGYLAEVDGDNMEEALDRLIDDNVVIEDRMMLEGCAYSHKKKLLQEAEGFRSLTLIFMSMASFYVLTVRTASSSPRRPDQPDTASRQVDRSFPRRLL